jgi:hypothetical protein
MLIHQLPLDSAFSTLHADRFVAPGRRVAPA